jgi:hypothetical protein
MKGQLKEVNEDYLIQKNPFFFRNFLANLKKYNYLIIQYAFLLQKTKTGIRPDSVGNSMPQNQ